MSTNISTSKLVSIIAKVGTDLTAIRDEVASNAKPRGFGFTKAITALAWTAVTEYDLSGSSEATLAFTNLSTTDTIYLRFGESSGGNGPVVVTLKPGSCFAISGEPSSVYRYLAAYEDGTAGTATIEIAGWTI